VYDYLRDFCPPGWISAVELHRQITATGAPVGKRNYIYDVLNKLAADELVEVKSKNRKNYRVRMKQLVPGELWKDAQVTQ
jgi:Fe2+ or Zn2+ uptake regulation protein